VLHSRAAAGVGAAFTNEAANWESAAVGPKVRSRTSLARIAISRLPTDPRRVRSWAAISAS
jgi:hypothetical protein